MKSRVRHYRGNEASVTFDTHRCIHAEVCVRGLPQVFDVSRRPWILPDEGDPKRLERVVLGCPTGALRMAAATDERVAPGAEAAATILPETPRNKNSLSVVPDGPLYARGNLEIEETPGAEILPDTRVAFLPVRGFGEQASLRPVARAHRIPLRGHGRPARRADAAGQRGDGPGPVHPPAERTAAFPRPPHDRRPRGRESDARPGKTLPVRIFEGQALLRRLAPRRGVYGALAGIGRLPPAWALRAERAGAQEGQAHPAPAQDRPDFSTFPR